MAAHMIRYLFRRVFWTTVAIVGLSVWATMARGQAPELPRDSAEALVRRAPVWSRRVVLTHVWSAVPRPDGQTAISELTWRRAGSRTARPGLALFRRTDAGWALVRVELDRARFERVYRME